MKAEIRNRKGARKAQDIPKEVLELLNIGKIETVNLTEWLAVDHSELIQHNFGEIGISENITKIITEKVVNQKKPSTMNTIKLIGSILYENYKNTSHYQPVFDNLSKHTSDSIRCYAPYLISLNEKLSIQEKFNAAKHLVADKHFGIREIVWMARSHKTARRLVQTY